MTAQEWLDEEELARIRAAAVGDMLGDSKALDEVGPAATIFRLCRELELARKRTLPRALEWTDEPPKGPGWYWFKTAYRIHIVSVEHDPRKVDDLYICVGSVGIWMSNLHGQWAGPIPEPREPKA